MKPSRTFWILLGLALAVEVATLLLVAFRPTPPGSVNIPKLMAATKAYRQQLQSAGAVVPAEVSLNQLVAKGLLTPKDVSAFARMKVIVTAAVDPQKPQQILIRARLPDGREILALNDGSVQERTERR